jgi:hypothetical protein
MSAKKADRIRSPRAPRHSLRDAVRYTRMIYGAVHRSPVDSMTAYRVMGFAGKSGSSATALGSIRQFGLIEGIGDKTRVSDLAMRVLEPSSEQEHSEALAESAHRPEVFRLLFERFENRVPPADEPLRAFLIRDLGFSPGSASDCIDSFRETLTELELAKAAVEEVVQPHPSPSPEIAETPSQSSPEARLNMPSSDGTVISLPLTRYCSAELAFKGRVTAKAIANLLRHIELMEEVWPTE